MKTIALRTLPMWAGFFLGAVAVYPAAGWNHVFLSGLFLGSLTASIIEFKIPRP